ncbi:hypothetical protein [Roseicyclus persicicus]|uniref:Uncharacterized protein n=1 Tax=Roseicyclus persicicus TaxID=2650661 RepID=A0A7X6H224_9RHOB|nr:hypothetical protein [Roseibacterium persicicum]NKX45919.1 hypothetical protein [Roseibacterium persicicum]
MTEQINKTRPEADIPAGPQAAPAQDRVVRLEDRVPPQTAPVSDHEMGELVLGAWLFALDAMHQRLPAQSVELAARRARATLAEKVETLPYAQLLDPMVQGEHWRKLVMITEQETLAHRILDGTASYAARKARA